MGAAARCDARARQVGQAGRIARVGTGSSKSCTKLCDVLYCPGQGFEQAVRRRGDCDEARGQVQGHRRTSPSSARPRRAGRSIPTLSATATSSTFTIRTTATVAASRRISTSQELRARRAEPRWRAGPPGPQRQAVGRQRDRGAHDGQARREVLPVLLGQQLRRRRVCGRLCHLRVADGPVHGRPGESDPEEPDAAAAQHGRRAGPPDGHSRRTARTGSSTMPGKSSPADVGATAARCG